MYELPTMHRSGLLLGACVAFTLSCTTAAWADDYTDAASRAAAARDRALETGRAQDWQEALELFAAAGELRPTPEAKFEFAEAARQLGFEDQALQAFEDALALGLTGKARERAEEFVAQRASAFGRLSVRGPAGARLYVDNAKRAVLPAPRSIVLAPGPHRVHVETGNQPPFERAVTIVASETNEVVVSRAAVLAQESTTPAPPALRPEPDSPSRWRTPVLVASGGLVVAGVTTALVSSVLIASKRHDLEQECAELQDGGDECAATTATHVTTAQSLGNDILALKGVRWVAVGAAVLGAGGIVLALVGLSRDGEKPARSRAALVVGPETVGVTWRSGF